MKVALVAMQSFQEQLEDAGIYAPAGQTALQRAEINQIVSIAQHMQDGGRFDPVLICQKECALARLADKLALPGLKLGGRSDIKGYFRLWKWQRQQKRFLLLAFSEESLSLAAKIINIRRSKGIEVCCAFMFNAPAVCRSNLKILHKSNILICGSSFIQKELIDILEQSSARELKKDWIIHPAGLDLSDYRLGRDQDNSPGEKHFVFGMANSMVPKSGALLVVRAMAAIWQTVDVPSWEVRMFGEGPRFREVLAEAKSLGVISRLSILGSQFPQAMVNDCDAWLAPGSSSWELPDVMGTALAAGLPLICTNSPLHQEWLDYLDGQSVLKVKEGNPQELAKAMLELMRDSSLRESLASMSLVNRQKAGVDETAEKLCAGLSFYMDL